MGSGSSKSSYSTGPGPSTLELSEVSRRRIIAPPTFSPAILPRPAGDRTPHSLRPLERPGYGHEQDPSGVAGRRTRRNRLLRRTRHERGDLLDAPERRRPLLLHREPGPAG